MTKEKAHDVLRVWNGNKSENCPVCNETLKEEAEIVKAAQDVAAENYHPRVNPNLGMGDALYFNEDGTPKTTEEKPEEDAGTTPASDEPQTDDEQPKEEAIKENEDGEEKKEDVTPTTPTMMSETHTPGFMTDVLSFSEGSQSLPLLIKIIPTGSFKTQAYGEVKITKEDLLEMADNFNKGVRAGVPIDIDHDQKAAAGWINAVSVQDDGMYAQVEWTKLGEDKLSTKEYRFFSPEFAQSYIDPEHSHELNNVLIAGSLVNRPMFKELPAIAGSEDGSGENLTKKNAPLMLFISNQSSAELPTNDQNNSLLEASEKEQKPMDLQTILAKEKSARTSDEQLFVAANLDQLSDEQKVAEGFVVSASDKTETTTTPEDNNPVKGDQTITAGEKANQVVISASELATLKAAAEKGNLAFSELRKAQITSEVEALKFNENGGKIAPAQVTPIVNLMMTMSEPQRAELKGILESLPDRKVFGEMGSEADLDKSKAADLLTANAKKLMEENQGMTFSDAMQKAIAANPELRQETFVPLSR